jgi:lipid-binding SYLF domain-containing protein
MRRRNVLRGLAALVVAGPGARAAEPTPAETRAALREMRKEVLTELYQLEPAARRAVRGAAGYAVFSQAGAHILFFGGAGGRGIVHDNLTGKDTYMKMASGAVGLGLGFKDMRLVFVFRKRDTLKQFVERGWQFGGESAAVAKAGETGGASGEIEVAPGVTAYQIARGGLIAQGAVQGSRYWKDEELN